MNVVLLGDPHLSKAFVNGVPLHRRGEREAMQWADFEKSVLEDSRGSGIHCCLGDLFDKMIVPYSTILRAARIYAAAAKRHPNTEFVVIRGNHDCSRDSFVTSAYDVFAALMEGVKNVHILGDAPFILDGHCFISFHPHKRAGDVVPAGNFRAVYGHYDIVDWENENPNLIPLKQLRDVAERVVTGHDHVSRLIHGGFVHVFGSMQPYSHAEDPEGTLYVTRTLDTLVSADDDRCVRLLLRHGEVVPADFDCLQLTVKRVTEEVEDSVMMEQFDLKAIFDESLSEVSEELRGKLWEKMKQ